MIVNVLPQTQFNYSYLVGGASEAIVIADNIPVADAMTISLSVRIHKLTLTSGASFTFSVYGVDPSSTDGTVFISATALSDTGGLVTSTPNLVGLTAIISAPIYPFVRVVLTARGPSATGTTYAELSADLVVRQGVTSFVSGLFQRLHAVATLKPSGTLAEFPDSVVPGHGGGTALPATKTFGCQFTSTSCPGPSAACPTTTSWACEISDKIKALTKSCP